MTTGIQPSMPYKSGVGAVEINIYNPNVSSNGGSQGISPQGQSTVQSPIANPETQSPASLPIDQQNKQQTQTSTNQPEQKPSGTDENKKADSQQGNIVPLTDNYIKSLENYLNNPNSEIRSIGVKELLKRFKEDPSRKKDPALTSLLNKSLQDPSQAIRLLALAALDSGYAEGDELTNQLLQNMQKSDKAYNQDAITAANILLKKAGKNLNVKTSDTNIPVNSQNQQVGQKLNLISG